MSHRRLRVLVGGVVLMALVAACSSATTTIGGPGWVGSTPRTRPVSSANQPNIVFVLTDDLSWNLVKYMPHVLAMEHHGVTFRRYFVTDSLCCPSRTSIMTGAFPITTGCSATQVPTAGSTPSCRTATRPTPSPPPCSRGLSHRLVRQVPEPLQPGCATRPVAARRQAGRPGRRRTSTGTTSTATRSRWVAGWPAMVRTLRTTSPRCCRRRPGQFIKASATAHRPFLAEISTFAPHSPFVPAPADASKFPGLQAPRSPAFGHAVVNAPRWLAKIPPLTPRNQAKASRAFQLRVEAVQAVDRMIGALQLALAKAGVARNTYFVFSSDNGFHMGEHRLLPGKQTAYDTDIRVPLVVTGPGVPAGKTNNQRPRTSTWPRPSSRWPAPRRRTRWTAAHWWRSSTGAIRLTGGPPSCARASRPPTSPTPTWNFPLRNWATRR